MLSGRWCSSNWYAGTAGDDGVGDRGPEFRDFRSYPALLGFDEAIDDMCHGNEGAGHAQACLASGFNILSLFGDDLPYNSCRNFEWQVRALLRVQPH